MTENHSKNQVSPVTDDARLQDIVSRGVADIIPAEEFERKLRAGERMRIYLGVDPTGPHIHLGHAVILWKMRTLQDLGHEIVLLLGDFTARIGDPTDKDAARTVLTHEEVLENAKTYQAQAAKILDFSHPTNPAVLQYNSEWLDALKFQDIIELSAKFTVQQMLERDMFTNRLKEGKPIYVHEFLYPIMQGYDSVAMDVDAEFGGNDQLFNMLTGRTLQKEMNSREKVVVTFELLPGLDGRKMSKGYGNIIGVMDSANDMYGKVMSLEDEFIPQYLYICANATKEEVEAVKKELEGGVNPRDVKMRLAKKIVELYHSHETAEQAEAEFTKIFQTKERPTEIAEYQITNEDTSIIELVVNSGMVATKSDARRLIEQGGVKVNENKIDSITFAQFSSGDVIQVGKRKFIRLV